MSSSSALVWFLCLITLARAYTPTPTELELFKRTVKQTEAFELPPESETTGSCSKQSSSQALKRNCRYGKCEQIKNGTDFVCHCDQFITGPKCDRPSSDQNDPCQSNPCWGDSLCIVLNAQKKEFKCLCSNFRRGKYCHIKLVGPTMIIDAQDHLPTSLLPSVVADSSLTPVPSTSNSNDEFEKLALNIYKTLSSTKRAEVNPVSSGVSVSSPVTPFAGFPFSFYQKLAKSSPPASSAITYNQIEKVGPCNYDTCQLGKCLENGTCECVHPAIGKFCDRIDECLVLKCVNGACVTGKGCICSKGFTGTTCEKVLNATSEDPTLSAQNRTTLNNDLYFNKIFLGPTQTQYLERRVNAARARSKKTSTSATTTKSATTTVVSTTVQPTTTAAETTTKYLPVSTKPMLSTVTTTTVQPQTTTEVPITTTTTTVESKTQSTGISSAKGFGLPGAVNEIVTPSITSCENGGLLIDNICICLNQFTGNRCEIAPGFADPSVTNSRYESSTEEEYMTTKPPHKRKHTTRKSSSEEKTAQATETTTTTTSTTPATTSTKANLEARNSPEKQANNTLVKSYVMSDHERQQQLLENEDDELPFFTINRYNYRTKNKNGTIVRKNIFWPWFECFPGNSHVTVVGSNGKSVQTKLMSELNIDDRVLVADEEDSSNESGPHRIASEGSLKFSRVVSFLHRIENIDADFVRLHYEIVETHNSELDEMIHSEHHRYRAASMPSLPGLNRSSKSLVEMTRVKKTHVTLTPKHLILVNSKNDKSNTTFSYIPAEQVNVGDRMKYYDYNLKIHRTVTVVRKEDKLKLQSAGIYAPLTESGTIIVDNIHASCYSMVKNHKLAQLFYAILNHLGNLIKITSESYLTYSKFFFDFLNFIQMSDFFLNLK